MEKGSYSKSLSALDPMPQDRLERGTIQNRICLDPQMHRNQPHSQLHHPGVLPKGDFCDAGLEYAPEASIAAPETSLLDRFWKDVDDAFDSADRQELESNPPAHPRGRVFRAMTGGDTCMEPIDVSGHRHGGHAPVTKVRPAPGVQLVTEPLHLGHHGAVSKLGPFLSRTSEFSFVGNQETSPTRPLDLEERDSAVDGAHLHAGHSPAAKVQPLNDVASDPRPEHDPQAGSNQTSPVSHSYPVCGRV